MNWYPSPLGYHFKHITDEDFEFMYFEGEEKTPGTVYKISHKRDKTGARVPNVYLYKRGSEMKEEDIKKIKNKWLKADTLKYGDIDPYSFFKSLYIIVKDKNKLPKELQGKVFTTFLDPKLSNVVKPRTREAFGEILDNI